MKISVQLTADDYIRARRLGMRPRPGLRYVGYVILVLFSAFLVQQGHEAIVGGRSKTEFFLISGVTVYFLLLYFVVIPWRTRRIFKQQKALQAPAELDLTDTHFMGSSAHGTIKMEWREFHKWKKNAHMVLVYHSEALMHMIPLRAFQSAEDIEKFVSILDKNLGPQKA